MAFERGNRGRTDKGGASSQTRIAQLERDLAACRQGAAEADQSGQLAAMAEQVDRLERELAAARQGSSLSGDAYEDEQVVQRLRVALAEAQERLAEQDELLTQLTEMPLSIGTVLTVTPVEELTFEDFRKGMRVRLDPSSGYYGSETEGLGRIMEIDRSDSSVNVRFSLSGQHEWIYASRERDGKWKLLPASRSREQLGTVTVMADGKELELVAPVDAEVLPGSLVSLNPQTMQIVEVLGDSSRGEIAFVRKAAASDTIEVDFSGGTRMVLRRAGMALDVGDRVVLDPTGSVVMANLGADDMRFAFQGTTGVTWEDIGGHDLAKHELRKAIEHPHDHADLHARYGKQPTRGVLLIGPPGCGKTMLGKAAATAVQQLYGSEVTGGFLYIKGPEILDKFVGNAEAAVRSIFAAGRKFMAKYGYPPVIYFDEPEAVLRKRGTGISSDINDSIVPMFLAEMDGLDEVGGFLILSTNRPDILDPAVYRDKRIDRKIVIGRPDRSQAEMIFRLHLKGMPLESDLDAVAALAASDFFDASNGLYEIKMDDGSTRIFGLSDVGSGAMIAGVCERAADFAIDRAIEGGGRSVVPVSVDDIKAAIDASRDEQLVFNHTDELAEYVRDFRDRVAGVEKLSQACA